MSMKFNLDFSILTPQERMAYLKQNVDFSQLTKKEIELCTNYVLYGKEPDRDNTSAVDRKEIYIKPKHKSYAKQEPLSLEALLESPTFDESMLKKEKNIYKKVKPEINKDKCKSIPGMQELWEQIEQTTKRIEELKEQESTPENEKKLYVLKHQLIEFKKEQYLLKEIAFPEISPAKNFGIYYEHQSMKEVNYEVYPRGLMKQENDGDFYEPWLSEDYAASIDIDNEIQKAAQENKEFFNFMDENHVYQLCLNYYEIKDQAKKNPDSLLNNLIWTLDFYIDKAQLNEQQKIILEGKKRRLLNKEICRELMENLGIYHQENYISTIWNKIVKLITAAAELSYDEWCCRHYEKAWKTCRSCGKTMLRDSRNFVKKKKAADGFTNRCKDCDRKKRKGLI